MHFRAQRFAFRSRPQGHPRGIPLPLAFSESHLLPPFAWFLLSLVSQIKSDYPCFGHTRYALPTGLGLGATILVTAPMKTELLVVTPTSTSQLPRYKSTPLLVVYF